MATEYINGTPALKTNLQGVSAPVTGLVTQKRINALGFGGSIPTRITRSSDQMLTGSPSIDGTWTDGHQFVGSDRSAQPHRCAQFDGTDDNVVLPSDLGISGTDSRTISAWVRTTADGAICSLGSGTDGERFTLAVTSGTLRVEIQGSGYTSSLVVDDDEWHHVAVTFEGSTLGDCVLYLDGKPEVATGAQSIDTATGSNKIGDLAGLIFDVQIFDFALTESQVLELFTEQSQALPTVDRIAHYPLSGQHPTIAYDISGNGYHGTKTSIDASVGAFHYEGADVPFSRENDEGFSERTYYDGTASVDLGSLTGNLYSFKCKYVPNAEVNSTSLAQTLFSTSGTEEFIGLGSYTGAAVNELISIGNLTDNSKRTIWQTTVDSLLPGIEYEIELRWDDSLPGYRIFVDGEEKPRTSGTGTDRHVEVQLSLDDVIIGSAQSASVYTEGFLYDVEIRSDADTVAFAQTGSSLSSADWNSGTVDGVEVVQVPLTSSSEDATGGTPTYTGKAPANGQLIESYCGHFDGSDDVVIVPDHTDFHITDNLTVLLRIESASGVIASSQYPIGRYDTNNLRNWVLQATTAERLQLNIGNVAGNAVAGSVVTDDPLDWSNVKSLGFTFAGGTVQLIVNGTVRDSSVASGSVPSALNGLNPDLSIGNFLTSGSAGTGCWDDKIFDVAMYYGDSGVLSAAQILDWHNQVTNEFNGQTLVENWPFAEGAGTVAHGVVNGHHGFAENISEAAFWATQDQYHYNPARGFDSVITGNGTSSYARVDLNPDITANTVTISAWVNVDQETTPSARIVSVGHTAFRGIDLRYQSNGFDLLIATDASNFEEFAYTGGALSGWNHIAVVVDGSTVKSYLNGTEVALSAGASVGTGYTGALINLENVTLFASSATTPSSLSVAKIRRVDVYEVAKSESEVADLFEGEEDLVGLRATALPNTPSESILEVSENADSGNDFVVGGTISFVRHPKAIISDSFQHPAGAYHNGGESKIDFTGGVERDVHFYTRANLVTEPEDFSSGWTIFRTSIASSSEISPSGSENATKLILDSTASTTHGMLRSVTGHAVDDYVRLSIFAKAAELSQICLGAGGVGVSSGSGADRETIFDLISGTVVTNNNIADEAFVEQIADGWFRCSALVQAGSTSAFNFRVDLADGDTRVLDGDSSGGIYIWGTKAEIGTELSTYKPEGFDPSLDTSYEFGDPDTLSLWKRDISKNSVPYREDRYISLKKPAIGATYLQIADYTKDVDLE